MNLEDVKLLAEEGAAEKLFDLFRQGFLDAVTIPELQTEAEAAAHHMLGCDNYVALMSVYATAVELGRGSKCAPEGGAADIVFMLADEFLRAQAGGVVAARGPIGQSVCGDG